MSSFSSRETAYRKTLSGLGPGFFKLRTGYTDPIELALERAVMVTRSAPTPRANCFCLSTVIPQKNGPEPSTWIAGAMT